MTSERVTQCPHCKATFKVSSEQLAIANGRVRCGACMNIFDALAYAVGGQPDTPSDDAPLQQETFYTDEGSEVSNTSPDELADSLEEVFQDNPDEDKAESGYSDSLLSDELSTSFLNLEEQDHDPYATDLQRIEPHFDENPDDSLADESWAESMLEDESNEVQDAQPEPEPTFSEPDFTKQAESDLGFDTDLETEPEYKADKKESYETLNFQYKQDAPKKRHWIVSSFLIIFNLALLVVLLAQIAWFNFEKFAQYPQAVKVFEQACEVLDCTLPELSDLSAIKSHNLVVRSHPTRPKALIIDTIIVNEADFAQSFPDIALYFSDINGKTIAQRLIQPKEYLAKDILNWEKMPSQESIHISLEILDPGREAVNYSLKFFPQQG